MRAPQAGLCDVCLHVKRIESRKGSVFFMCLRSKEDPRFRQYPAIPVYSCIGFEADAARTSVSGRPESAPGTGQGTGVNDDA